MGVKNNCPGKLILNLSLKISRNFFLSGNNGKGTEGQEWNYAKSEKMWLVQEP